MNFPSLQVRDVTSNGSLASTLFFPARGKRASNPPISKMVDAVFFPMVLSVPQNGQSYDLLTCPCLC